MLAFFVYQNVKKKKKAKHKSTTVNHFDSVGISANKVFGFDTTGNFSVINLL